MTRPVDPLQQQLDALPRALEPPRDLWPAIAAGIHAAPRPRWPYALAASVLLILVGTAIVWTWRASPNAKIDVAVVPPASAVTAVSFAPPRTAAYLQAHDAVEQAFRERLALLRPQTRTTIEANLKIIRDADAEIRRALESDPASPVLLQLLQNTQRQEIDLYTNVARNTEPAARGSSL